MAIHVKFFASLREHLGRDGAEIDAREGLTIAAVWRAIAAGEELPPTVLAARNQVYAGADERVQDGDEIAFFPPVTGG